MVAPPPAIHAALGAIMSAKQATTSMGIERIIIVQKLYSAGKTNGLRAAGGGDSGAILMLFFTALQPNKVTLEETSRFQTLSLPRAIAR